MSPNVTNVDGSFWNKTIPSNMLTVFSRSKVTLTVTRVLIQIEKFFLSQCHGLSVSAKFMRKCLDQNVKRQLCLLVLRLPSSLCSQRSTTYS